MTQPLSTLFNLNNIDQGLELLGKLHSQTIELRELYNYNV